jgi:predicted HAD superfamily Cof-like phosphohydrolase
MNSKDEGAELEGLRAAQDAVAEFHRASGHPVGSVPHVLSSDRARSRGDWMREEVDEFLEATDIVGQADAMIDLIYFALGTLVEIGVDAEELFALVHKANMAKLSKSDPPVFRPDGKVMKPDSWVDPREDVQQALVHKYTKYHLVVADHLNCVAACLAMVAEAVGLEEFSQARFAQLLPPPVPEADSQSEENLSEYGVKLRPESFDKYFEAAQVPLSDSFLPAEFLSEIDFADVLEEGLSQFDAVAAGFDASLVYTTRPNYGHFCLVAGVHGSTVLLVDPGPATAGLQSVHIDSLLAAIRRKPHGIHRFRRYTNRDNRTASRKG